MQGVWVQTLVRGIRFLMLHGVDKKKNLETVHLEDEDLENNSFKLPLLLMYGRNQCNIVKQLKQMIKKIIFQLK